MNLGTKPKATNWSDWLWRRFNAIIWADRFYGRCGSCARPWSIRSGHSTWADDSGGGCFPLCEECWTEMTVEERLPHYDNLFKGWRAGGYWDHTDYNTEQEYIAHLDRLRLAAANGA